MGGEPDHEYLGRCAAIPLALCIKRIDIADQLRTMAPRTSGQLITT
jgi:hypothetical protein